MFLDWRQRRRFQLPNCCFISCVSGSPLIFLLSTWSKCICFGLWLDWVHPSHAYGWHRSIWAIVANKTAGEKANELPRWQLNGLSNCPAPVLNSEWWTEMEAINQGVGVKEESGFGHGFGRLGANWPHLALSISTGQLVNLRLLGQVWALHLIPLFAKRKLS